MGWVFFLCFQGVVSWVGWGGVGWGGVGRVFKGRKGFFLGWHGEWGGLVVFKRREGKGQGLPKDAKLLGK